MAWQFNKYILLGISISLQKWCIALQFERLQQARRVLTAGISESEGGKNVNKQLLGL